MVDDPFAGPPPSADPLAGPPPKRVRIPAAQSGLDLSKLPGWQQGGEIEAPGGEKGIIARVAEGVSTGFGESKVTDKESQDYPVLSKIMQAIELPGRAAGGVLGAASGLGAGLAEKAGVAPADADRLQRDLGALGTAAGVIGGAAPRMSTKSQVVTRKVETPTLDKIERTIGKPRGPEAMGIEVEKGVKGAQRAQQAQTDAKYKQAFDQPGEFHAGAMEGVGSKLKFDMAQDPTLIVDATTPQTAKAIGYLDKGLSQIKIENKVAGQPNPENIVGINLRGIEQVRKNLVKMRSDIGALDKTDRRAFNELLKRFDDHIEKTIENGLFSGDPKVLDMIRDARASASQGFKLYGPGQRGDAVSSTMAKIVQGKKSPQAIANMLINASRVGARDLALPLVDRLQMVLKEPEMNAIREAMFTAAKDQKAGLHQLAYTRIGEKLFDPYQIKLMRQYLAAKDRPPSVRARIGTAMEKAVVHGLSQALPGHTLRTIAKTGYEMSRKKYGGVE